MNVGLSNYNGFIFIVNKVSCRGTMYNDLHYANGFKHYPVVNEALKEYDKN